MTVIHTLHTVDNPAWDAGASLIESMAQDGAFVFTVGQSIGIVCGLTATDLDAFYGKISHAFWIETGRCKVMESGSSKTGFYATTPATIYKIERVQSTVRYYTDGVLRYTSLVPSTGTVLLDCSLFAYGDTITTVERILYDGNVDGDTSDLVFPPLTGFGLESSALSYGGLSFQALIGVGESLDAHSSLTFPTLTGFGIEAGTTGYGSLQFPALQGQGEVTEGTLRFAALRGTGFEENGMGEGWLPALQGSGSTPIGEGAGVLMPLVGWGIVADGEAAVALGAFTGFGVEDGVFYGTGTLSALTGAGFEIYDRPDFNQGWFFLRSLRGYGNDYPDFDGEAALELPLYARGTDTDLVGGLTFPALRVDGQLQYGAYFNIPIKLNLRNISYNITYDSAEFSEILSGEITAYALVDSITNVVSLSGRLSTTLAHSDTGYAIDSLNSTFSATATDNAQFTDILGPCDWTVVAQAFIGEGDRLLASDVIASSLAISGSTTDIALATDSESAGFLVEVSDSVVAQEVVIGELALWAKTTDIGIITESFNYDLAVSGLSEQIRVIDAINTEYEIAHADTATVSDELILQLRLINTVDESVIATVDLGYSTQETGPCDETATFAEVLILSVHQHATDLSDALTATDLVLLNTSEYVTLLNSGIATDALTATVGLFSPLTESFVATTGLSGTLNVSSTSADTGVITDLLLNEEQTLYVINADTGAVSTYIVSPVITGLAQYEGILYMAGPQGLEALDASSDAGVEITWTVHTGFNNFGTDFIKRLLDVNLQARIQKDTNLVVVSNQYGQKYSYRYRLPILTRDSYRDGVIKVGKGISSVYWQVILQGKGEAEIDQIRLRLETLSRRR